MPYDPPDNKNIFFNFTDRGYEAPTDELLFNFKEPGEMANLTAAVQVLQLYRDTTYTYKKYCPKYVVGYSGGKVQVIKGPCVFGGIRDLGVTIEALDYASTSSDLPAVLNVLQPGAGSQADLPAEIYAATPSDIRGIIRAWHREVTSDLGGTLNVDQLKDSGDIGGVIDTHSPGNIKGIIRAWAEGTEDLGGTITGDKLKGSGDIDGIIDTHSPRDLQGRIGAHAPGNLSGLIRPYGQGQEDLPGNLIGQKFKGIGNLGGFAGGHYPVNLPGYIFGERRPAVDLPASIHSWQELDLGAVIDTHSPRDLRAYLDVRRQLSGDIAGEIMGWALKDLPASINLMYTRDLPGYLNTIQPVDLPAYIRVQPSGNLGAITHVWQTKDLSANIDYRYFKNLPASLTGLDDAVSNYLKARIKGVASGYLDLQGVIQAFHYRDLPAYLKPIYVTDLPGIIAPIVPKNLQGILHGWQELDLPAYLNAQDYPYNLPASIYPDGKFLDLSAFIHPKTGTYTPGNLPATAAGLELRNLIAYLYGDAPGDLSASITALGGASNLNAYIRPKMIRLTTYVSVPTMERLDLSAIINVACVYSNSANLSASMYVKYKSDLPAYIRPLRYNYKPTDLGARIGWADSYTEVDKYDLRIIVKDSEYYTEDMYRLVINTLSQEHFLSATIRGTMQFRGLAAQIRSERLPTYTYSTVSKTREKVINKTYDQILRGHKTVELAFEDIVKDYHYSPSGDYAWKTNQFQRWMLSVASFIPANLAISTYRKLYKATTVYNFARFKSVDEAIRNAIAYVTEQPVANLGATIYNKGFYNDLGATIGMRTFTTEEERTLSGSITGNKAPVIISTSSGVQKI